MKRLISAVILFVLLITIYFTARHTTQSICGEYKKMIENCTQNIESGNSEIAYEYAKQAAEFWEDKKEIVAAFANHAPVDEIAIANTEIKLRAKENEKSHLKTEVEKVYIYLERIEECLKFSAVLFY